jgi:hypothetical protein
LWRGIEKAVPSFQKALLSNVVSTAIRYDVCQNSSVFGGVTNRNLIVPTTVTISVVSINDLGSNAPCVLGSKVPGYAFGAEAFTSPVISDFSAEVSSRRNVAPSVPTTILCSWVSIGEIPTRSVSLVLFSDLAKTVVSYQTSSFVDVGYFSIPWTLGFPISNTLCVCLFNGTTKLFCSDRFYSYSSLGASITASPVRLAATLAMDVYGIVEDGPIVLDGFDDFTLTVLTSSSFTARTNIYVSQKRNLVVIPSVERLEPLTIGT